MAKHPIQPIELVNGVERFKMNAIVHFLLDAGPYDLNMLAARTFSREDREQFVQLIGFSWSGASDCSEMSNEVMNAAQRMHNKGETEEAARLRALQDLLAETQAYAQTAADALEEILVDARDD